MAPTGTEVISCDVGGGNKPHVSNKEGHTGSTGSMTSEDQLNQVYIMIVFYLFRVLTNFNYFSFVVGLLNIM